nr:MAG: hypothetical protein [Porcellio scaber clopovirus]
METPNVKVIIYDLKFKIDETIHNHSIIKIIPPITLTEDETGKKRKVSLSKMSGGRKINLYPEAYLRPTLFIKKLDSSFNAPVHIITDLKEFLYFLYSPDIIKDNLTMLLITPCNISRKINTSFEVKEFNLEFLSNKLFPQWKHYAESSLKLKGEIEIFDLTELLNDRENEVLVMKKLIKLGHQTQHNRIWNSDRTSLENKILEYKLWRLTYECFNSISGFYETIFGINKENSQNSLSQRTFSDFLIPSSKYLFFPNANCKRSSPSSISSLFEDEFKNEDVEEFISSLASLKKCFNSISKDEIRKSKCSFLLESVFEDLLNPYLPELLKCGKTAFIRFFSLGGIPSLAEITVKSQENPWNLVISEMDDKKISQTVSQTVFNNSLNQYVLDDEGESKKALEEKREAVNLYGNVGFNTVVPVFTPKLATILKKLLRTNVLKSVCSYCILKNPRLSNENAHLSALVSLWTELIFDNDRYRSEFTEKKIKSICSTAATYLDSPLNKKYKKALFGSPELALREYLYSDADDAGAAAEVEKADDASRSRSRSHDNSRYKVCSEKLSKAIFFLYIYRAEVREEKKIKILYLLVLEFINRIFCILWSTRGLKYTRLLIFASLHDTKDQSFDHYICIVSKFLEEKLKEIDKITPEEVKKYCQRFKTEFINENGFNLSYIQEFNSTKRIGDFSLQNLRERAPALFGIPEVAVTQIFETKNLFSYAYHYLGRSRHSWTSALGKKLIPYEKSRKLARSKLQTDFENDVYKRVYQYLRGMKTEKLKSMQIKTDVKMTFQNCENVC